MHTIINKYSSDLVNALKLNAMGEVTKLGAAMLQAWKTGSNIYFCGNGGSAGNANHLANDFIYGAGTGNGTGLRAESLSANSAVLTCLANDIGYDNIYSEQIRVKGNPGDILIVLSGSGNSPNVVNAIDQANKMGLATFAVLGFTGGRCKELAQVPIHFEVHDMQIAEDLQLIVGHMCMQWLSLQNLSVEQ
jgi:D-sedoheptulose 7-phosphate isomerase